MVYVKVLSVCIVLIFVAPLLSVWSCLLTGFSVLFDNMFCVEILVRNARALRRSGVWKNCHTKVILGVTGFLYMKCDLRTELFCMRSCSFILLTLLNFFNFSLFRYEMLVPLITNNLLSAKLQIAHLNVTIRDDCAMCRLSLRILYDFESYCSSRNQHSS